MTTWTLCDKKIDEHTTLCTEGVGLLPLESHAAPATCFLLVTALFFIDRKTKVLPHFAFTKSVLSLMEEGEHSSVAIFTLVLVHMHACFCARTWHGAGSIYQYLSIFLLYITVHIFLDTIDIITHHYFLHPLNNHTLCRRHRKPSLVPRNCGRKEPDNIREKCCWLSVGHHSWDQRRTLSL